jgi:Protein of unknown function DUF262
MKIELKEITVKKLTDGFLDSAELGVFAYGGKLDIRPPYQREFIYKDKQRNAVIDSVREDFPLNVMYWAVRNNGQYEVIDGQQRTLSICQYVNGDFSINGLAFHNLQDDEQKQILDYKLMVYFCSGTDSEKLDWFRTINIAGEEHTDQELRNAVQARGLPTPSDTSAKQGVRHPGWQATICGAVRSGRNISKLQSSGTRMGRSKSTCRSTSTTQTRRGCGNTFRRSSGG